MKRIYAIFAAILFCTSFSNTKPKWQAGTIENPNLIELSGLAPSIINAGKYWGHNDSLNAPILFLLGANGKNYGQVNIDGALNLDWEAIQVAKCQFATNCVYIGDIGDNYEFRETVRVELIPEPKENAKNAKVTQSLILKYPDGPHNSESLLINNEGNRIYLIEKLDWKNRKQDIKIYGAEIPNSKEKFVKINLQILGKISNKSPKFPIGAITDAAFYEKSQIIFRDYRNIYLLEGKIQNQSKLTPYQLVSPKIKQSEALTISHDGAHLLVGSEGKNSKLLLVEIKKAK